MGAARLRGFEVLATEVADKYLLASFSGSGME
jgi:hypothetical protein